MPVRPGLLMQLVSRIRHYFRLVTRSRWTNVPKLSVHDTRDALGPSIWVICPDFNKPSGGIRKLYRCVDILNEAGLRATIVHTRQGFRCNWFTNATKVIDAKNAKIKNQDLLVIPETYAIGNLPPNVRQVIFNQNIYNTLQSLADPSNSAQYLANPNLSMVIVVSQDNAEVFKNIFPGIPFRRLRLGIDSSLFYPPRTAKHRKIAYMPRRRPAEAEDVLRLLKLRGALDGWEVVAIDRCSEAEAAALLREAAIFLSFSLNEGFGLPPLEALACGCFVVGYHGFGGREYFHPPFATSIENGNIAAFAQAVEVAIRKIDEDPLNSKSIAAAGAQFVSAHYSMEAEKQNILDIFIPLLRAS